MTLTQNAANHIAAPGQHFREHLGTRLTYALHGHLPYEHLAALQAVYDNYNADAATRTTFETWFLPLFSLKNKSGTRPEQLPALFKHFIRARLARPSEPEAAVTQAVRLAVAAGGTDWIANKINVATVLAVTGA